MVTAKIKNKMHELLGGEVKRIWVIIAYLFAGFVAFGLYHESRNYANKLNDQTQHLVLLNCYSRVDILKDISGYLTALNAYVGSVGSEQAQEDLEQILAENLPHPTREECERDLERVND